MRSLGFLSSALIIWAVQSPIAAAADKAVYDHFYTHVQPLLANKCISCHGPDKQSGGLRLDARNVLRGGDSGPAITPGDPERSLLIQAISRKHEDLVMPPKENLTAEQVAALVQWVKTGAVWPEAALVLFEDEPDVVPAMSKGKPGLRLVSDDRFSGSAALAVAPRDRMTERIAGWQYPIREKPAANEYRYLRFAWKKRGSGGAMIEVANDGTWPDSKAAAGRYVAGSTTSGLQATTLAQGPPESWAVATIDLWRDLKDSTVTGISLVATGGGEALFDLILLGPTVESLDAYAPGRGRSSIQRRPSGQRLGDAWRDPQNPIVRIFEGKRLDLWSLKKLRRSPLPEVRAAQWPATAIDAFILARLESKGITPSPEADRRTLIRRLTFDLTGLPPTPEEVRQFEADQGADAYPRLVERLLASPHYGEHWARRWLDVVRYADSNGFERDEFRPTMYRYRDYVIRSFNEDKPYDQFLKEQLAGDEMVAGQPLDESTAQKLIATGFMRLGPYDSARTLFGEDEKGRDQLMADLVNTTGSAMLGLTMSCCRCHDHKYDPISQADHFRLQSFFAAVSARDDMVVDTPGQLERVKPMSAAIDAQIAVPQKELVTLMGRAKQVVADARRAAFPAEIRELLKGDPAKQDAATKKKLEPYQAKLKILDSEAIETLKPEEKKRQKQLVMHIGHLRLQKQSLTTALGMTDVGSTAPPTRILSQGDYLRPLGEVQPGFLSVFEPNDVEIPPSPSGRTTGRRTALANWITSPDNPFTARVLVNRMWQSCFGQGIVSTPSDFGHSGDKPSHPELLDWLASELIRSGWSVKQLHRQIVLSATYRQASGDDTGRRGLDPDNTLLWRQNPRRLDAEMLRDSLLAVSGKLLPTSSGPPVWPSIPDEIIMSQPKTAENAEENWLPNAEEQTDVRTIFTAQKRSIPLPLLDAFDLPDSNVSCARRNVTTVAPQALMLLNSPFAVRMATALADRVTREVPAGSDKLVERTFLAALGRSPDPEELAIARELLARHTELHRQHFAAVHNPADSKKSEPQRSALVDLCRAVLNTSEFMYID